MKTGLAFYLAAVILGFLLAPNKFYVISFAGMALYILAVEGGVAPAGAAPGQMAGKGRVLVLKYLIFNAMYIPAVLLFQEILFSRRISALLLAGVLLAGQAALWNLRPRLRVCAGADLAGDPGADVPDVTAACRKEYKKSFIYRYYSQLRKVQ